MFRVQLTCNMIHTLNAGMSIKTEKLTEDIQEWHGMNMVGGMLQMEP